MQQNSIDYAEHGGVRTNPKRKCQQSDKSEGRFFNQHPKGVTQILKQCFHGSPSSLGAQASRLHDSRMQIISVVVYSWRNAGRMPAPPDLFVRKSGIAQPDYLIEGKIVSVVFHS